MTAPSRESPKDDAFSIACRKRIYPRCLSHTAGDQLTFFSQNDGIGLGMFADLAGKKQGFLLFISGRPLRCKFQIFHTICCQIPVLLNHTIEYALELLFAVQVFLFLQQYPVLLLLLIFQVLLP
jgi:hypothetical protein